jgi:hypothetical protein
MDGFTCPVMSFCRVCCLPKGWPRERLKPGEEYPPGHFLVVSAEMLALLLFPVALRDCALVTLDP